MKHPGDTANQNVPARAERRQGLGEGRVSGGKERAGGVAEGELERDASKKEGPTELRAGL